MSSTSTRYYPGDLAPIEGGGVDRFPRVLVRDGRVRQGEEKWIDISEIVRWADPERGELGVLVFQRGAGASLKGGDPLVARNSDLTFSYLVDAVAKVPFRLVSRKDAAEGVARTPTSMKSFA